MWTFGDVKLADAALSPALADPGAAAAALNKATVPGLVAGVPVQAIMALIMQSPTDWTKASASDWVRLDVLANSTRSLTWQTAPSVQDNQINLARLLVAMAANGVTIAAGNWTAFLVGLTTLSPTTISASTLAAITALGATTTPKWTPALDAGVVQTARAQP